MIALLVGGIIAMVLLSRKTHSEQDVIWTQLTEQDWPSLKRTDEQLAAVGFAVTAMYRFLINAPNLDEEEVYLIGQGLIDKLDFATQELEFSVEQHLNRYSGTNQQLAQVKYHGLQETLADARNSIFVAIQWGSLNQKLLDEYAIEFNQHLLKLRTTGDQLIAHLESLMLDEYKTRKQQVEEAIAQQLLQLGLLAGILIAAALLAFRRINLQILKVRHTLSKLADDGELPQYADIPTDPAFRPVYDIAKRLSETQLSLRKATQELKSERDLLEERVEERVSDLSAANQEIQDKAEELEQASRYKSEFLANMSHELRTPLNSMLLLSKGLADNNKGHLDEEETQSARIVHDASQDLLTMINDILDLSKVEAGKIDIRMGNLETHTLANSLEYKYKALAHERGLDLQVNVDQDVPQLLQTDPLRVQQIITNLISNALKFTKQGNICINYSYQSEAENGRLIVTVSDSGIGIAEKDLQRIFNVFEQVDGSNSRDLGGTGLGLPLSRRLAKLLGGTLSVNSRPGLGSCFTLKIPVSPAALDQASHQTIEPHDEVPSISTPPLDQKFSGESVLIVDDDMRNVFSLARMLNQLGLKVLKASSADKGIELLESNSVDAVCMDIMMPEKDGFQAMREIRQQKRFQNLSIVALTAKAMEGDRQACIDAGANHYVSKPINFENLIKVLQLCFQSSQA